jgi:TRAP-type C4-dicarboxylate transport system substrate-binding protein
MQRRHLLAATAALATLGPAAAAAETFKLTIASSHPTTLAWVGLMQTHFVPEVNRRLQEAGGRHTIEWREAFGGQLYKQNATLSSVEQGITDIGWVFTQLEAAKMPLFNVTTVTPFTTDRLPVILDVMNELVASQPAMAREWDRSNAVFLGSTGVDTYHLFTKAPVRGYADLKGLKLGAPGAIGLWLKNSGAVPVDGSLQTYYTDLQTGVIDGTVSIPTGILPAKIYEVAPYVTTVNIGALSVGALAMNKDSFAALPKDVQAILKEAGRSYTQALGAEVMRRAQTALATMVEVGKGQSPPVTVSELPAAERKLWIESMPNIAQDWVKANAAKGLPAQQVLDAYMAGLRQRGVEPARAWDKPST